MARILSDEQGTARFDHDPTIFLMTKVPECIIVDVVRTKVSYPHIEYFAVADVSASWFAQTLFCDFAQTIMS